MSFQRFCDWLLSIVIVLAVLFTMSVLDQPVTVS